MIQIRRRLPGSNRLHFSKKIQRRAPKSTTTRLKSERYEPLPPRPQLTQITLSHSRQPDRCLVLQLACLHRSHVSPTLIVLPSTRRETHLPILVDPFAIAPKLASRVVAAASFAGLLFAVVLLLPLVLLVIRVLLCSFLCCSPGLSCSSLPRLPRSCGVGDCAAARSPLLFFFVCSSLSFLSRIIVALLSSFVACRCPPAAAWCFRSLSSCPVASAMCRAGCCCAPLSLLGGVPPLCGVLPPLRRGPVFYISVQHHHSVHFHLDDRIVVQLSTGTALSRTKFSYIPEQILLNLVLNLVCLIITNNLRLPVNLVPEVPGRQGTSGTGRTGLSRVPTAVGTYSYSKRIRIDLLNLVYRLISSPWPRSHWSASDCAAARRARVRARAADRWEP
eukprot:SAG31_NODE_2910_length_4916_cov_3.526545_5_plen_390_part_00